MPELAIPVQNISTFIENKRVLANGQVDGSSLQQILSVSHQQLRVIVDYVDAVITKLLLQSSCDDFFDNADLQGAATSVAESYYSDGCMSDEQAQVRKLQVRNIVDRLINVSQHDFRNFTAMSQDGYLRSDDIDPHLAFLSKAVLYKPLLMHQVRLNQQLVKRTPARDADGDRLIVVDDHITAKSSFHSWFQAKFYERANDPRIFRAVANDLAERGGNFYDILTCLEKLNSIDSPVVKRTIVEHFKELDQAEQSYAVQRLCYTLGKFDSLDYDQDLYDILERMLATPPEIDQGEVAAAISALRHSSVNDQILDAHPGIENSLNEFLRGDDPLHKAFSAYIWSQAKDINNDREQALIALARDKATMDLALAILPGYVQSNASGEDDNPNNSFINRVLSSVYDIFLQSNTSPQQAWDLITLLTMLPITEESFTLNARCVEQIANADLALQIGNDQLRLAKHSSAADQREMAAATVKQGFESISQARNEARAHMFLNILDLDIDQAVPLIKELKTYPGFKNILYASCLSKGFPAAFSIANAMGELKGDKESQAIALEFLRFLLMPNQDFFQTQFDYGRKNMTMGNYHHAMRKISSASFYDAEDSKEIAEALIEALPSIHKENRLAAIDVLRMHYDQVRPTIIEASRRKETGEDQLRAKCCEELLRVQGYTPYLTA